MTPNLLEREPRSILLVRLSARGDIVFSSPMVRALRRSYPQAHLTWLVEAHTAELIRHHPELDEVLVWDRSRWRSLLRERRFGTLFREARKLVRDLRSRKFDLALDLQGLLRSGVWTFLSGAATRIGLQSREGSGLFMTRVVDRDRKGGDPALVSSEYLYLARQMGLDVGDFRMEVPLTREDRTFARAAVRALGLSGGYAVAVPFTTLPSKHWFEDRWARLMDDLERERGLPTVILGGPGDQEAQRRIRAMTGGKPRSLVGETSLTQAAALLETADLVIGVDTGLTHMGMALERPTIAIFGSNIPYTDPRTEKGRVLVHWLECSPCRGNPTCDGEFPCLRRITVEEVMATVRDLLGPEDENTG